MAQRTWRRLTLEVAARDADIAGALLDAVTGERVAVEQREGARFVSASAYVDARRAPRAARELRTRLRMLARDGVLRDATMRRAAVSDVDWSQAWKRHFLPFRIAPDLYIVPPWRASFVPPSGAKALVLDPGMAFGTGQHATTRLAVRTLLRFARPSDIVIDVGCGSGILGIAAAQRGAAVYAFDNDPIAVAATRRNFTRNRVRAKAIVRAERISAKFPKAGIIVANITGQTLQGLAPNLAAHLAARGLLITSGITVYNRLEVLFALARAGLTFIEERRDGEWFAYAHQKTAGRSTRAKLEDVTA